MMLVGLFYVQRAKRGIPIPKRLLKMLAEEGGPLILHVEMGQVPSLPVKLIPLGSELSTCGGNVPSRTCPLCRSVEKGFLALPDDLAKLLGGDKSLALSGQFDHLELWRSADFDRASVRLFLPRI